MKHSLMLIESPNKINTISRYLKDTNIKILATIGHIRELDEKSFKGLGFDETTYEMKWRNDSERTFKGKKFDVIETINAAADASDEIFLSTDPDREGEAISWHIYSVLNEKNKKKCKRVVFNEITKDAITKALSSPRSLDQNQINSYLARKLLDRGLGFKLSDFAQKAIGGVSAGRVQSIALKFLKDKYEEIKAFVPEHWFNIYVLLENGLELNLKKLADKGYKLKDHKDGSINFVNEKDAKKFLSTLDNYFTLEKVDDPKQEKQKPPKAFKTSTMQSTAINKLHMSVSTVDRTAQMLYEGVEIDGEAISLITYPRTDREDLSETFVEHTQTWLFKEFGKEYVADKSKSVKEKKTKDKELLVQGAHEGIRPTYIHITPDSLDGKIEKDALRLYRLIWLYAVSSLMKDAIYNNVLYHFDNNKNKFTTNNRIEKFEGFKALFKKYSQEENLLKEDDFPDLKVGEKYKDKIKEVKRVDKRPPSPYTESTLIKSLEEKGIGRPSTYSHIVNIVVKREYANKDAGKLIITDLGLKMSEDLEKFFPNIMQYDYTRNMEQELDNISENKSNWKTFLDKVFQIFNEELNKANKVAFGNCPECGAELKARFSVKTRSYFIGCTNYPKCKYIGRINKAEANKSSVEEIGELCPDCQGALVKKKNKWGSFFISCSKYPECKYIRSLNPRPAKEPVGRNCPDCGAELFKRFNKWNRPFICCSKYPDCKYLESIEEKEELDEKCPECSSFLWKLVGKYNKPYIKCSSSTCKYTRRIAKYEKSNTKKTK
ncbi:DNA topoisomerase 1 [Candidatus Mycoplasma haematohominis]|uniref:DNA topoisomerase 1 n=1 Tax=Candidatus Mycoplasma haematohominis TaxID=1494318 RepID=A0A478FQ33_9MOLU|nr:DNA topoisomerase 1 [Candidatus Mycoplasma haemohominis]